MASWVEFEPAPAITGTRPFACSTHHSTTWPCSWCVSVGLSPVVPTGTRPLVPSAICQSTRPRKAFSSTEPLLKGVTSAVNEPLKLVLAVMTSSSEIAWGVRPCAAAPLCRHCYREGAREESPRMRLRRLFAAVRGNGPPVTLHQSYQVNKCRMAAGQDEI